MSATAQHNLEDHTTETAGSRCSRPSAPCLVPALVLRTARILCASRCNIFVPQRAVTYHHRHVGFSETTSTRYCRTENPPYAGNIMGTWKFSLWQKPSPSRPVDVTRAKGPVNPPPRRVRETRLLPATVQRLSSTLCVNRSTPATVQHNTYLRTMGTKGVPLSESKCHVQASVGLPSVDTRGISLLSYKQGCVTDFEATSRDAAENGNALQGRRIQQMD